jgi:hypothetical protein
MAFPLAQQQPILAWGGDTPSTREDILAGYLHLREISKRLHEGVVEGHPVGFVWNDWLRAAVDDFGAKAVARMCRHA